MTLPSALPRLALPVGVVLLLAVLARLFDPHTGATPLISSDARGYYLAAFFILGCVLAVEVVRRGVDAPEIPTAAAGWTLITGSATLLFADHSSPIALVGVAALAVAEGVTRDEPARHVPGSTLSIGSRGVAAALLWVFLFGLVAFHLRWLFALPLAGIAGGLGYLRFEAGQEERASEQAWPASVAALATMQLVAATSFLDISAGSGAALIVIALAGIYAAGRFDWERIAA